MSVSYTHLDVYKRQVPQELYPVEIIKYLLQPILENSIVHGAKKNQRTWIRIKARYFGKFLVIKIEDNGTGVDKEYLEKIRENIVEGKQLENTISSNSSFIGLRNIYKRLQLIYGEEAELLIDSKICLLYTSCEEKEKIQ